MNRENEIRLIQEVNHLKNFAESVEFWLGMTDWCHSVLVEKIETRLSELKENVDIESR